MNLISLLDRFNSDDACRGYLETLRWPNGVACPRCGDMDVTRIKWRSQWDCQGCGYHLSVSDLPPRTSPPSKLDSEPFEVHSKG